MWVIHTAFEYLSPPVSQFVPQGAFSACVGGFSLRGTDSVDVHWSLWHRLRTPLRPVCTPGRPLVGPGSHNSYQLTHWPVALILSDAIASAALEILKHSIRSLQVDVCKVCVGGRVRACYCKPPIDEAPGSTLDNKSACRLLFSCWDVDPTCNTQMFSTWKWNALPQCVKLSIALKKNKCKRRSALLEAKSINPRVQKMQIIFICFHASAGKSWRKNFLMS